MYALGSHCGAQSSPSYQHKSSLGKQPRELFCCPPSTTTTMCRTQVQRHPHQQTQWEARPMPCRAMPCHTREGRWWGGNARPKTTDDVR